MSDTLAVVTVTFSPGDHLAAMLDSLKAATKRSTYTILADNGSRDGVPQKIAGQRSREVEFLDTGGNVGYGAGINAGIRRLKKLRESGQVDPTYVLITNPDVVFDPGSVDALIAAANRHADAGAVGPAIREPDGSPYPSARAVPSLGIGIGHALFGGIWKSNPWTRRYLCASDQSGDRPCGWLSGSCLLVAWDVFDKIGGFDERYFMYMEDVDLGDRIGRAGYRNWFIPDAHVRHDRGHAAGKLPATMLPAHHASAYRFLADRYRGIFWLPLRVALRVGLKAREIVSVAAATGRFRAAR